MARELIPGKLVIASHNQGKIREIRELLAPYRMELISAGELGLPEPEETGTTYVENALLKAYASMQGSGMVALADDSGLCVDALGGDPGVYTADWAETPNGRDWSMAMQKVETALSKLGPSVDRSAHFVSTLALVWPDGEEAVFEGRVSGHISWPPRGENGFGYDPVFVRAGDELTFGELDPAIKYRIDHRADAFAKLVAAVF